MSTLARFMVHPVTLMEPATSTNSYGDTVPDWSLPPVATVAEKGWFTRTSTDEMAQGREAITDDFELSLPPTSVITPTMRIERDGKLYEVRGSVQHADSPEGPHHLVVRLRRVEG